MENAAVSEYSQRQILAQTRHAAEVAHQLVDEIAAGLKPGMTEGEARTLAKTLFADHGITQTWHNPYIYFGSHTLLTFLEKPKEEFTLQEDDIAFIDIGPIVDGVEGDAGKTVVFGDNPLFWDLKYQSERIFNEARTFWADRNPTGVELYEYVHRLTREAGYDFHLDPAGHLIGSFPHKGWKAGLHTYPFPVEPGLWILEIQFRHPTQPYGAFYESVLV